MGCIIHRPHGGVYLRESSAADRHVAQVARITLRMKSIFKETTLKKSTTIKAPSHLRKLTQAWWEGVNAEYALEPHHLKLLTLAAESWDRANKQERLLQSMDSFITTGGARPGSILPYPLRKQQRLPSPGFAGSLIFQKTPRPTIARPPYVPTEDKGYAET